MSTGKWLTEKKSKRPEAKASWAMVREGGSRIAESAKETERALVDDGDEEEEQWKMVEASEVLLDEVDWEVDGRELGQVGGPLGTTTPGLAGPAMRKCIHLLVEVPTLWNAPSPPRWNLK
ncbi:uncharacterized protein CIMG_13367 [Coccidioides immitis RS]|uniref:Uncharacterized protein n=1 Tax=Coccidioides immitis (strain RS) TaxID=246410 RepID=A0A0D8JUG5_COCIM|nr:uncharacterized protein CIMG_13367 [Coccidioides immitis RS]KJF60990.1 hypothetical protein CIMG_13367 [Coccidioides immitis RS]TPX21205.1 hypothetical protein DIZ76_015160 [Coccidioides immitis]